MKQKKMICALACALCLLGGGASLAAAPAPASTAPAAETAAPGEPTEAGRYVIINIKNTNPQSDMPFKQGGSKGKEGPKNGDASMKSDRVMPDLSVKVTQTGPIRTAKGGRPSLLERRSIRTLPSLSRTFPVSSSTLTLIRP
ncbi:hypothetical protein [Dialister hominis]|uniref:hypothetical protein n=1 Tax=Dialister hominis TaxID=2582419 RepID=UPI003AEF4C5A